MPTTLIYCLKTIKLLLVGVEPTVRYVRIPSGEVRRAISLKATRNDKKIQEYLHFMIDNKIFIPDEYEPTLLILQRDMVDRLLSEHKV